MMTKRVCVLIVALGTILNAVAGFACSVGRIPGPEELVANADLIVHATAIDYAGQPPGNSRTTGVTDTVVRFRIESVLKGAYKAPDLLLNGYLGPSDDWNDKSVPYTFVRRGGRSGSCYANTYRSGGQFVLMLRRATNPIQGVTEYTVNWAALAPVNEQVRSADDPWVRWVKAQIQTQSGNTFSVVFRSDAQQFTVTDPARLGEIRKKMDDIDFWNATKFPMIVVAAKDQTCDSQMREQIDITAIRGTVKAVTFLSSGCTNATVSGPAQELLSLIELIKGAAPAKP